MVANKNNSLLDQDVDSSDWTERHNASDAAVSLDGRFLTDDTTNLTKWTFPCVNVVANSYLRVFASGKTRSNPKDKLRTNFQLQPVGEYLDLIGPNSNVMCEFAPQFSALEVDVLYDLAVQTEMFFDGHPASKYDAPTPADRGLTRSGPNSTTTTRRCHPSRVHSARGSDSEIVLSIRT